MEKDLTILNCIKNRVSVRGFEERPVERDIMRMCIEAACMAPSAENAQPWRFIIVDDPRVKNTLGKEAFSGIYRHTQWALNAPVLVVLLMEMNIITHRIGAALQNTPFSYIDMGIAGEHFVLQAQELGLGTCWIGWFHVKKTHRFFNLPRDVRVCSMLAVGYASSALKPRIRRRKALDEILFYNSYKDRNMKEKHTDH